MKKKLYVRTVLLAVAFFVAALSGNILGQLIYKTWVEPSLNSSHLTAVSCITGIFNRSNEILQLPVREEVGKPTRGLILLGDSRFVGMEHAVDELTTTDGVFTVAKVGKGYDWLIQDAAPRIEEIVEENPQYDEWFLVTGLGVNDVQNIENYKEFYCSMSSVCPILLSVNPVGTRDQCMTYGYNYDFLSEAIPVFNDHLDDLTYPFVDTYSYLMKTGFATVDGIHYTNETYQKIWNYIYDYLNNQYGYTPGVSKAPGDAYLRKVVYNVTRVKSRRSVT